RLWSSAAVFEGQEWRGRRAYIFSFHGLVDLASTAPFYLQILVPGLDLRILRTVRLLRVFKLSHYSTAIEDLFSAVYQERKAFVAALYLLLIAVILTSTLMYFAETHHQPEKFSSIPDSIYWSLITLTTVGYGDVSPITWLGKVISIVTAFMGVCVLALLTGIVASAFANQMARRKIIFETQLRKALEDGVLDDDERASLESLRVAFNLSEDQVAALYIQAKKELHDNKS
ncbi:MAG: potassium channel family protein, partial [Paracoccaceae bacterium]